MSNETATQSAEGLSVLVVDDEKPLRALIVKVLQRHGYVAMEAATGREGLDLFRKLSPDIVVTDVRMPEMNGLELLRAVKEISPQTTVAVMTGYGSEDVAVEAIRCGASNYFKKPFGQSDFVYAIGVMADLIRSRRAVRFDFSSLARESRAVELPSSIEGIYGAIHELTRTPAHLSFDVEAIRIGLLEMITNAVEHGNLGISGPEKQEALREGTLGDLYRRREREMPGLSRKVAVTSEFTPGSVAYTVEDEGEGFDWRGLPDPSEPANLLKECGRGIILTRLSMDEVAFNEKGNAVTIVKRSEGGRRRLSPPPSRGGATPPARRDPRRCSK